MLSIYWGGVALTRFEVSVTFFHGFGMAGTTLFATLYFFIFFHTPTTVVFVIHTLLSVSG